MNDQEQDLQQAIPSREGGGEPLRPPRRRAPIQVILIYIMVAAAAAFCLQLTTLHPLGAVFGSAVAMAAFWIGFGLLNPAGAALLLGICLLLGASGHHPSLSVAMLAASGVAGAVGARLSRLDLEEDNYFFAPALILAGMMALLITLGAGGGWELVLRHANQFFSQFFSDFMTKNMPTLHEMAADWTAPSGLDEALRAQLPQQTALFITSLLAVFWALVLWLAGRLARRRLGRMRGIRTSLFMFRIEQRYIFLLILGLVLEIFNSLGSRDTLGYGAWPILGVVALAAFLEGLGIVMFMAMIRRMAGQPQLAFWISTLGIVVAVEAWFVIALAGLADVWFDFRKLERLRRQLDASAQDQKD